VRLTRFAAGLAARDFRHARMTASICSSVLKGPIEIRTAPWIRPFRVGRAPAGRNANPCEWRCYGPRSAWFQVRGFQTVEVHGDGGQVIGQALAAVQAHARVARKPSTSLAASFISPAWIFATPRLSSHSCPAHSAATPTMFGVPDSSPRGTLPGDRGRPTALPFRRCDPAGFQRACGPTGRRAPSTPSGTCGREGQTSMFISFMSMGWRPRLSRVDQECYALLPASGANLFDGLNGAGDIGAMAHHHQRGVGPDRFGDVAGSTTRLRRTERR